MRAALDKTRLTAKVGDILNHWPVAGLAVAVIRSGSLEWFHGHGVADIDAGTPVDEDTVFRIASLTKTITAIAVMQLQEQGLVELDAPAADYLRAYRLVPARAGFGPVTLRHLLTHTAGVRAVRTASDLLRPTLGWGVPAGRPVPALAEYYRAGLRFDTDPGTRWAYSNHGFAALGQIVEDVTGISLDRYVREHVFGPLGMNHSDLARGAQGTRLHPDGNDPDVFRVDLPGYGSGTSAVVFSREPGGQVAALHLGFFPWSLRKRR